MLGHLFQLNEAFYENKHNTKQLLAKPHIALQGLQNKFGQYDGTKLKLIMETILLY